MIFISMTSTLTAAVRDQDVMDQLSSPATRFVFACARRHVFRGESHAPAELAWHTDTRSSDGIEVARDDVADDLWAKWSQFKAAVAVAEADGRVWWGLGRADEDETGAMFDTTRLPRGTDGEIIADRWNSRLTADRLVADGHAVYGHHA